MFVCVSGHACMVIVRLRECICVCGCVCLYGDCVACVFVSGHVYMEIVCACINVCMFVGACVLVWWLCCVCMCFW